LPARGKTAMQKTPSDNNFYFNEEDALGGIPEKAAGLFEQQVTNWPLASGNYKALDSVQVKHFEFDGFTIDAQFNPGRIVSSSAKVDPKSIQSRPCFLCSQNLPPEQRAVKLVNDYILLVNPFPIFSKHFTIPSLLHIPQSIYSEVNNMLIISELLGEDYTLFYNGPRCGASAPDHLHFQAGNFGFMRIDDEYEKVIKLYGKTINKKNELITSAITGYHRNFLSIESGNRELLVEEFKKIYNALNSDEQEIEPMLNIICTFNKSWRLLIFPRSKHRPTYFFEEGEKKILISPAAVDLGGVCIFPREEDFKMISKELIIDIFEQVTLSKMEFEKLIEKINFN
jgi:ATP adenylyltransferase/5',5'''-P-1,P-4-tetraphosphate phosphorylase II